jgi:hypothetical protein
MALSIRDNIKRIEEKIRQEKADSGDLQTSETAQKIQKLAVAAIIGGAADWEPYMKIFATDENDKLDEDALQRLRPEPNTEEAFERNTARAYLIGNGNCGPNSVDVPTAGMDFGVGGNLDSNLPLEDNVDFGVGDNLDSELPVEGDRV